MATRSRSCRRSLVDRPNSYNQLLSSGPSCWILQANLDKLDASLQLAAARPRLFCRCRCGETTELDILQPNFEGNHSLHKRSLLSSTVLKMRPSQQA